LRCIQGKKPENRRASRSRSGREGEDDRENAAREGSVSIVKRKDQPSEEKHRQQAEEKIEEIRRPCSERAKFRRWGVNFFCVIKRKKEGVGWRIEHSGKIGGWGWGWRDKRQTRQKQVLGRERRNREVGGE